MKENSGSIPTGQQTLVEYSGSSHCISCKLKGDPMFPLIPLLVDTAIAVDNPNALHIAHEWGVVVFEQSGSVYCGGPEHLEWMDPGDACAEAPVVWIHGEPFQGSFIVTVPDGESITFTHPQPSSSTSDNVRWNISAALPESYEESPPPYSGPYEWALESWRSVPSIPLTIHGTGEVEKFLYYECTVNPQLTEKLFHWGMSGNPVIDNEAIQEALYFTPYGIFPVELTGGEFIPLDLPMAGETDPELAEETFCRWADSMLKSSEIEALWETWRPVFSEEDSYWLVFPIPEACHNGISSISLETGRYGDVEYHRLFLGAVELQRHQETL